MGSIQNFEMNIIVENLNYNHFLEMEWSIYTYENGQHKNLDTLSKCIFFAIHVTVTNNPINYWFQISDISSYRTPIWTIFF